MNSTSRTWILAGIASLLWCILLMAQWAAGPRDGVVTAVTGRMAYDVGIGPTLGRAFLDRGASAGRLLALMLLVAPSLLSFAVLRGLRSGANRVILGLVIGLGIVTFLELPQLSNDVFLYRAAGEMLAEHGVNPYLVTPSEQFGPTEMAGVPWSNQQSPYGPLALGAFAAAWSIGGSDVGSLWVLRCLLALPWILAALVFWRARPATALWLATSPLLLLEVVQSGHLDGWVGLLLIVACRLADRERPSGLERALLVAALAGAIALKLSATVVLGAGFVHLARRECWGIRRASVAMAAVGMVVALALLPLWAGPQTLDGLRAESTKVLQSLYQLLDVPADLAGSVAAAGSAAALLAGAAAARAGWSLAAASILALVLQAVIGRTFLQPWYFVPALMLVPAARIPDGRASGRIERALADPCCWAVATTGLLSGGYALVFWTRSVAAPIQSASVALMLLPGLAAFVVRARLNAPASNAGARRDPGAPASRAPR